MSAAQFFAVPAGTPIASCRSCGRTIYWIVTGSGKRMPIDCTVPGAAAPTAKDGGQGVSHFATCPDANTWRKPA